MHAVKILSFMILVASSCAFGAEAPLVQFEHRISELETKLNAETKIEKRYELFLAAHEDLVKIRKDTPPGNEVDTLAMSMFLDTLADFPAKKNFQPKKCASYLKKSKTMMASRDKEASEDPMVARAFKVGGEVCR